MRCSGVILLRLRPGIAVDAILLFEDVGFAVLDLAPPRPSRAVIFEPGPPDGRLGILAPGPPLGVEDELDPAALLTRSLP